MNSIYWMKLNRGRIRRPIHEDDEIGGWQILAFAVVVGAGLAMVYVALSLG